MMTAFKTLIFLSGTLLSHLCFAQFMTLPFSGHDLIALRFLGFGNSTIAISEMRGLDASESSSKEVCKYAPIQSLQPDFGKPLEHTAYSLHLWPLPEQGKSIIASSIKSWPIYDSKTKDQGCTSKEVARQRYEEAVKYFSQQKISLGERHYGSGISLNKMDKKQTKNSCFITKHNKLGCEILRPIAHNKEEGFIKFQIRSKSDCVIEDEKEFKPGCQAEHHYSGEIKLGSKVTPFDFIVPQVKDSSLFVLESIHIYSNEKSKIVLFYFSWILASSRENTVVVLRLQ